MATTATVTLSSDIFSGFSGYSKTMTMYKDGSLVDIDSSTGYSKNLRGVLPISVTTTGIYFNSGKESIGDDAAVDLITMANELVEPLDNTGAKVYIKHTGNGKGVFDKSVGVKVLINSVEIGVLYGGDWLLMPVTVVDDMDVVAAPENNNAVVLEYTMFYE